MVFEQETKNSMCPGCGTAFDCGAIAGLQTCWCMEKPTGFLAMEAGSSCYCPACLDKLISEQSSQPT